MYKSGTSECPPKADLGKRCTEGLSITEHDTSRGGVLVTGRGEKVVAEGPAVLSLLGKAALAVHEDNVPICDAVQIHVPQPPAGDTTHSQATSLRFFTSLENCQWLSELSTIRLLHMRQKLLSGIQKLLQERCFCIHWG